jgi:hypothetical protein
MVICEKNDMSVNAMRSTYTLLEDNVLVLKPFSSCWLFDYYFTLPITGHNAS